jgi:hypothetical protein
MRRRRFTSKSLPAVSLASAIGTDMAGNIAESGFAIDRSTFCALGLNKIKSGRQRATFCLAREIAPYSLFVVALAQQVLGEIAERGPRQCGERQRTGDVYGREPEPCGEESVENAFAEPLR